MRKTLVVNSGSSSLKYMLFDMPDYKVIAEGILERIGLEIGNLVLKYNGEKIERKMKIANHEDGIKYMLDIFSEFNVIEEYSEITKVGHRVVQGGEYFKSSVLVGETELKEIKNLISLAPLHNGPNSIGIEVFTKLIPTAQNIAVFDTTFHQTMKEDSYIFPVPYNWYTEHAVRRYGAHGTSHHFISDVTPKKIGVSSENAKIISCHLGNGASISAIEGGKCIQTSMGLTPLGGIMMGTRSGDIDPSILQYIASKEKIDINQVTEKLNKESGLLGLSGVSSDFRDIMAAIKEGNERAKLALDVYTTRIAETIGSYYVRLGGLDAIVFTAGIGENVPEVREIVGKKIAAIGVTINDELNQIRGEEINITGTDSKVQVWVIPTEEEYQIAKEAEKF